MTGLLRALSEWRHKHRRARKRLRMLRDADLVVLSLGKSGRTWLRTMISHLYHQRHGIPEQSLIGFDNFHRLDPTIPRILFTHDLPRDPWNWRSDGKEPFLGKRVLLLVRDPRDVAVSMYFHHAKRTAPARRAQRGLPENMARDLPVADFMLRPDRGRLEQYVRVLNRWAERMRALPDPTLVARYEDLHAMPGRELARVAAFLGGGFTDEQVRCAVAFASLESLREKERRDFFGEDRLRPAEVDDPDSYKVRRGEVGGWRAHLTPEQATRAAAVLARLDPAYGYGLGVPSAPPGVSRAPATAVP
jgi:alcohol sulfotransferase